MRRADRLFDVIQHLRGRDRPVTAAARVEGWLALGKDRPPAADPSRLT